MKKAKRIFAMIGVILILAMYVLTIVFACMKSPQAKQLLTGAIICTIAVPVVIYAITLVIKNAESRNGGDGQQ